VFIDKQPMNARERESARDREREGEPPLVIMSWCFLGEEPSPGSDFSVS
jgi:hypothetical protein